MEQEILKYFVKKGFLLDKEMLEFFSQLGDEEIADKIMGTIRSASQERIITKSLIDRNDELKQVLSEVKDEQKKVVEKYFVNLGLTIEVRKERYVEEIKKKEIFGNGLKLDFPYMGGAKKLEVEDFTKNFRNRYLDMKSLLQERKELQNLNSIDRIGNQKQNISIIGMVYNKRITKNKNILLEVEDLTGKASALVNLNKPEVYKKAKEALLDEVIGMRCSWNGEWLFVNDIIFPDAAIFEKKRAEEEVYALFTSDAHVGSERFLEENFSKFIRWINGEFGNEEEAKKIKYLFFVGDNVDGVGIFPGQENILKIKDIKKQYEKLAGYLKKLRKDIRIIMCPGQHDSVRVAEPQPAIDKQFAPALLEIENLTLVTNPCYVTLEEGFEVLMYHGASFHGVINDIESLRLINAHDKPTLVVKELLKRRHLAPTHSSVVYIPGEKDSLMIRKVPDIFTTGEMHKTDIDTYNNILLIANSCWQSITPYEEKVGNHPDPCKVPMLNLKTREIKILDFSDTEEKICREKENKMVCETGK